MRSPVALLATLALIPTPALPQRTPVLSQIDVPHPYYYREMFLPQVTTGPSAVSWSPDGKDVVFAMQGSLWRQRLGDTVAVQLTAGAEYDYQPDWSPDGKRIAFASYAHDAIELRLLDLASGTVTPLTDNHAVNVEPRWSPDGARIAFVSTAFKGRWHVFVLPLKSDAPGSAERVTEDRDSKLPRYYYSVFDHYLSPTWSPDGQELILVSNRDHTWGAGSVWRMEAHAGAEMRQIHDEETSWRARPDWSRDGRRLVYSSYLGRQWNQLWLMPAEGGDAFQLTYGDFDATSPRWSPDASRIAYISNEGGNTSLWTVTVPGGERQRMHIGLRRWREPVGTLRLRIVEKANGRDVPARISVTAADGRTFAPTDAWQHADDSYDRAERKFEEGYFHADGSATLTVPAGTISVVVTRGMEFRVVQREVTVPAGGAQAVTIALERLDDLPARGWFSGDMHIHMNYGGHYRNTPSHLAFQARAEDLHVAENLIVNKEGRFPDIAYFTGKPDPASTPGYLVVHDQEYHTSYWGHVSLLGLTSHVILPGYAGYVGTSASSIFPANANVLDLVHAQGGIGGYVHAYESVPDPAKTDEPLTHEFPIDAALGKADYVEVLGFADHLSTAQVWYRLLNCGFHMPTGAGTDAMADYASLRGPVGLNRVYVRSGVLDHHRWLAAIRAGKTFATNGPLLGFTIDGHDIGDSLGFPDGKRIVRAHLSLRSIVPVDHLEIVGNGVVVATVPLTGDHTTADATIPLPLERSGWYTLRAWSDHAQAPVLDMYPFATTSPIYVTVGGRPMRSRADADYFLAWIDRARQAAEANTGWNSTTEKDAVLDLLRRASDVFHERAIEQTAAR